MKQCLVTGIRQTGAFLLNVLGNLGNGLKLVLFLRVRKESFALAGGYLWAIAFLLLGTCCTLDYFTAKSPDVFSSYALQGSALLFALMLFAGFVAACFTREGSVQAVFPIIFLNAIWIPLIAHELALAYVLPEGYNEEHDHYHALMYVVIFAVAFRSLIVAAPGNALRQLLGALGVVAISWFAASQFYYSSYWYEEYNPDDYKPRNQVFAEDALSDQFALLDAQLEAIAPRKKGKNYYVVTYGADDSLDVFMKEALTARAVLTGKFKAEGRAITLINNPAMLTQYPFAAVNGIGRMLDYLVKKKEAEAGKQAQDKQRFPLATVANLGRTLKGLGAKANPEEDVLVLYLTSHGSRDGTISVALSGVTLNQLKAADLKKMLDASKFKWKVLLISACFSGSFIDNVKDDNTIILTSSREDRVSYGCGKDDELTYFGRALLEHALSKTDSILAAYEFARENVEHQEEDSRISKHSQPQLYVGRNARSYLK